MNAIVMAGASRGRGRHIIMRIRHGFTLLFLVLYGLGSGSASLKPLSISPTPVTVLGSRSLVSVYGLRHISSVVYSAIRKGVLFCPAVMPRLCQRMLSRRGTLLGAPSRPSFGDVTSRQHHSTHNGRESILRPNQFLEPSSPGSSSSPSFGSAIFTFNSSLNRPRISAHVSVLFIEEAQEEGESSVQWEDQGIISMPIIGSSRAMETSTSNVNDAMMEPVPPGSTTNEEVHAQDLADVGWCRIVEEVPEA